MEEANKDWMIRMVGGREFLLVPAHPGSPRQRAVKRLLLLLFSTMNDYHCKQNCIQFCTEDAGRIPQSGRISNSFIHYC